MNDPIRISACRPPGDVRCPVCGLMQAGRTATRLACGCRRCTPICAEAHLADLLAEAIRQRDALSEDLAVEKEATAAAAECGIEWAKRAKGADATSDAILRRQYLRLVAKLADAHEERDDAIRERDLAIAHDTQAYPTAEAYERVCTALEATKRERDAAKTEALKWRRIRTPTHGSCCTCQGCGLDHESCRCDLDETCDELDRTRKERDAAKAKAEKATGLLRECEEQLRLDAPGYPFVDDDREELLIKIREALAAKGTPDAK